MDTYTVKQGDTLRKLAKQFGKTVDEFASANSIENPNLIKVGQELVIPGQTFISTQGQANTTTQNANIDMAFVPENVPTVPNTREEIKTPEIQQMTQEDFNKLFSQYNQTTTETTKSTEDPLFARQTQLQEEIKAMEEAMAKRTAVRTEELDVAGVFADMRKLNDLKAQLKEAEDRAVEIPIEAKQRLRGTGATQVEFAQTTLPELEKSALSELVASRQVSRLTDTINTNIAIIDQQLKGINDQQDFVYKQKQQELENVQKIYGDIMTEAQKARAEEAKLVNDITMAQFKWELDYKGDMLKKMAESGVDTSSLVNAPLSTIQDIYSKTSGGANIIKISDNDAKLQSIEKLLSPEMAKQLAMSVGVGRDEGLGKITSFFSRPGQWTGGAFSSDFENLANNLASKEALDYFVNLKSRGATFGALSNAELGMITSASSLLATQQIKKTDEQGNAIGTGLFNATEKQFKEALTTLQRATMKDSLYQMMGDSAYKQAGLVNEMDVNAVKAIYDTYKQKQFSPEQPDYLNSIVTGTPITSANLPQRNNNPGNIKAGGLSDDLATGTDSQGHLVFPTPEAGFEALIRDVQAKVSGNSKYLQANPTLAQLGSVYAEDPNWSNSVAKILGVTPETKTQTIPIESLVLAIAMQEGYFA
jgi:LysM repeat protein